MIERVDPYKGKPKTTHPLLKVAGTGRAVWDTESGRWVA